VESRLEKYRTFGRAVGERSSWLALEDPDLEKMF